MTIWRHYRFHALVAILVTPLFILMPDGKLSTCFTHVRLSILSITHSCDGPHLAEQAADPAWLFHTPTYRSRPVYLMAIAAGGMVLSPLALLLEKTFFSWITIDSYDGVHSQAVAERARMGFELYAPLYTGMMAFNIFIALAGIAGGLALVRPQSQYALWGLALALAGSPLMIWIWWFHTALMNFLVPLSAIAAFAWAPALLSKGRFWALGLGGVQSLLILVYPYMAISTPSLILGWLWSCRRGKRPAALCKEAGRITLFLMGAILPILIWLASFMVDDSRELLHETRGCGQFSWIACGLSSGHLLAMIIDKLEILAERLSIGFLPWGIFPVAAILLLAFKRGMVDTKQAILRDNIAMGALFSLALMITFLILQGFFAFRSLASLLMALMIFTARLGRLQQSEMITTTFLMIGVLGYAIDGFLEIHPHIPDPDRGDL